MQGIAARQTGDWRVSANCQHNDPDALFVRGAQQHDARTICEGCPVLKECLSHALDNRIEFGVWGGFTERQRRALVKRCPDVTSWADYLDSQPTYDAEPKPIRHLRAA